MLVLLLRDTGKFYYQKAFGKKSPTEDITVDATFVLASCTKLITSIAALQCVEKGQIRLDDDVSTTLTELQDIKIITGFEEGSETPIFKKATKKITLRFVPPIAQFHIGKNRTVFNRAILTNPGAC